MSEQYVPTTNEVRAAWIEAYSVPAWGGTIDAGHAPRERVAEFDRWHRQVKAEALREAAEVHAIKIPDVLGYKVPAVTVEDLLDRADRIESQETP